MVLHSVKNKILKLIVQLLSKIYGGKIMALKTKQPVLAYVFFTLAVVVAFGYFAGFVSQPVAESLIGLFGFGGLAGLRKFVDSKGWKTYFAVAMAIIGIIGRYLFPEVFTPSELDKWLVFWGTVGAGSLAHGVAKSKQ